MATYKVIQDIEAEDKLVGPLSLKQFIYACIAAVCSYLSFIAATKGASFLLAGLLPVALFTGFFAFPWGRDQPTEIWALAKIRYFLKPRRRIWDQSGMKELVNITAPKHIEQVLTNNLTETQVQSRLTALAATLDSRGWAVKNANLNLDPVTPSGISANSDRLISPGNMPQAVASVDITAGDDIMDERNNPRAQRLDQMINDSSKNQRTRLIDRLRMPPKPTTPGFPRGKASAQLPAPADNWYTNNAAPANTAGVQPAQPPTAPAFTFAPPSSMPSVAALAAPTSMPQPQQQATFQIPSPSAPSLGIPPALAGMPTADEEAFMDELRRQQEQAEQASSYQHMKVVQPLNDQSQQTPIGPPMPGIPPASPQAMTPPPNPATIGLSKRDDLTISAIANIANGKDEHPDEVVISLHNRSS